MKTKDSLFVNQKPRGKQKEKTAENKLFEGIISDDDFTRIRSENKHGIG